MFNESDELTRNIQEAALEVFKEFHTICVKNKLTYFAIGGTCIGAIRHKGYIPWDDDIDVAMPYDDYLKFLEIARLNLRDDYSVITPHNCRHYVSIFSKLQNKNTTFIEEIGRDYKDRYSGIYIDIFPLFGLPKSNLKKKIIQRKRQVYNSLNLRMRFSFRDETNLKGKILWVLMYPFRWILPFDYFIKIQIRMLEKYKFDESDKIYFCWRRLENLKKPRKSYNAIFDYKDFSEMEFVQFEDTEIAIPKGYHGYLSKDFGDYMKLPPVEKRVSRHPKSLIDLKTPYSYYLENGVNAKGGQL